MMIDRLVRTSQSLQAITSCYVATYTYSNQSNKRYNMYSVVETWITYSITEIATPSTVMVDITAPVNIQITIAEGTSPHSGC